MSTPYYQDDLVTLYHGDCREVTEWLAADVLVTDPPYGVRWEGHRGTYRNGALVAGRVTPIAGDDATDARDTVLGMWGDRPAIAFGSWRAPRPAGVLHRLIWHKLGQAPGPLNAAFMSQDEEIYVIGAGAWRKSSPPLRSVIATSEARSVEVARIGHPTPKPVPLMETLLNRCPPGVVADPFAGSGSTLRAAKNLGRRAIGVEIDERYCDLIASSLSQDCLFGAMA